MTEDRQSIKSRSQGFVVLSKSCLGVCSLRRPELLDQCNAQPESSFQTSPLQYVCRQHLIEICSEVSDELCVTISGMNWYVLTLDLWYTILSYNTFYYIVNTYYNILIYKLISHTHKQLVLKWMGRTCQKCAPMAVQ